MSAEPGLADQVMNSPAFGPWSDPGRRASFACAALAAVAYVLLVDTLWTLVGIATVGGLVAAPATTWFEGFDLVTRAVAVVYLTTLSIAAVAFIRWQRVAIRNLLFLGCRHPEHGTGIATAGWFIPFVSLVLPWLSLREIARWSRHPGAGSASALLGWWWGTYIISGFVATTASVGFQLGSTSTIWVFAAAVDAVGSIGLITSAILAVKMVRTLTAWQRRSRMARLATSRPQGGEPGSDRCYNS